MPPPATTGGMFSCRRLFSKCVRLAYKPGDDAEERELKGVVVPVYIVMLIFSIGLGVRWALEFQGFKKLTHGTAPYNIIMGTTVLVLSLKTRIPARTIASAYCWLGLGILIPLDWIVAAKLEPRFWSVTVLYLDWSLVAGLRDFVSQGMIVAVMLWLAVERAEAVYGYGLYEAAGEDTPAACSCASPPCTISAYSAVANYLGFAMVFLLDFYLTRGFATSLRQQLRIVNAVVAVTEKLTDSLADYNLEKAEEEIFGEDAALMPEKLRESYEVLIKHMRMYKPYLPDSVLVTLHDEDSGWYEMEAPAQVMAAPAPGAGEASKSVCICFTDIQSSTALWEACPQGMYDGLRLHNVLIRKALAEQSGYEVKTIGDAFMIAFPTPLQGCSFALSTQEQFVASEWPRDLLEHELCAKVKGKDGGVLWNGLRIRVGLHYGETRVEANPVTGRHDFFGPPVNTASRVEGALRHGGLVGVTGEVLAEVGDLAKLGSPLKLAFGTKELKGVREKVDITVLLPSKLAERRVLLEAPFDADRAGKFGEISMRRQESNTGISGLLQVPFGGGQQHSRLALRLRSGPATCATVRVSLSCSSADDTRVVEALSAAEQAADVLQGTIAMLLSGLCVVVWNTGHDHASRALQFMQRMCRVLPAHVGAATGCVQSGNITTGRRRFATIIGGTVELSMTLAEEAEIARKKALLTGSVAEHCAASGKGLRFMVLKFPVGDPRVVWSMEQAEPELDHREMTGGSKWDLDPVDTFDRARMLQDDAAFVGFALRAHPDATPTTPTSAVKVRSAPPVPEAREDSGSQWRSSRVHPWDSRIDHSRPCAG